VGYAGHVIQNAGRQNRNSVATAGNGMVQLMEANDKTIQRASQTESNPGKPNVQCYNCNARGHYVHDCPQPKVRDLKFFREQMLLALKDEAGGNLKEEEMISVRTQESPSLHHLNKKNKMRRYEEI
ncbi:reverse transcriptase domain-containing protein, partial [Tanacetum coccineum]